MKIRSQGSLHRPARPPQPVALDADLSQAVRGGGYRLAVKPSQILHIHNARDGFDRLAKGGVDLVGFGEREPNLPLAAVDQLDFDAAIARLAMAFKDAG